MRDNQILYDDLPRNADEDVSIAISWLRRKIRSAALADAVFARTGTPLHPAPCPLNTETSLLADEICNTLGWPPAVRNTAINAEWDQAQKAIAALDDDIRRIVWPLCKIRSPGRDILSAAHRVCERAGIYVPESYILDLCRRIALATVPSHGGR